MWILGISSYYHDSAACLIRDGEIIAASQEERFTRIKHDKTFPINAISFCISFANIEAKDIDYVVFYDKPFLKFERIISTYLAFAPKGFSSFVISFSSWITDKLFQRSNIIKELSKISFDHRYWDKRLLFSEHHLSHAASAFFPSPFSEAAILTIDGVGEWTTTSVAIGKLNQIDLIKEIHFPHSLGLLYSAFTYYLGFKVNSGEYKVMGLAPYGKPLYVDIIKNNLISIKVDGSFFLDMSYFDYCVGLTMTNDKFHILFGGAPRLPETPITQREMDIAASLQVVLEDVVLLIATNIAQTTGQKNLCLAGGVALNCTLNGKLIAKNLFDNIWIQPAAGDAGGAIGAAFSAYHMALNRERIPEISHDLMKGSYLGREYSRDEIFNSLSEHSIDFTEYNNSLDLVRETARILNSGAAIGWHQGRSEFGPRSLGSRSILADPRIPDMQKTLNLKVKFRESFRPFAPAVLEEHCSSWFELDTLSPYMLVVAPVKPNIRNKPLKTNSTTVGIDEINESRSLIPAVTHVDYSARIQTVGAKTNPLFYSLLLEFFEITGCPILVNTSFNIRGEPIVESPNDAIRCFFGTDLDYLVIGNFIISKLNQSSNHNINYQSNYELD